MSGITYIFQMSHCTWGVMAVPLHPWSSWIKILFFHPWSGMTWTWIKTKFRVVAHLRFPVDDWTVRKSSKKSFKMMGAFVRFWRHEYSSSSLPSKSGGKSFGSEDLYQEESQNIDLLPQQRINGFHCYTLPTALHKCMSLCQTGARQSQNSSWLSGSSQYWSSCVCAAVGSGLQTRSMVNKGTLGTWLWLWTFGLTAEAA